VSLTEAIDKAMKALGYDCGFKKWTGSGKRGWDFDFNKSMNIRKYSVCFIKQIIWYD
jgi:hypothetical protein